MKSVTPQGLESNCALNQTYKKCIKVKSVRNEKCNSSVHSNCALNQTAAAIHSHYPLVSSVHIGYY